MNYVHNQIIQKSTLIWGPKTKMNSFKLILFCFLYLFFSILERTIYGRKTQFKRTKQWLDFFCPGTSSEEGILYDKYPSHKVKVALAYKAQGRDILRRNWTLASKTMGFSFEVEGFISRQISDLAVLCCATFFAWKICSLTSFVCEEHVRDKCHARASLLTLIWTFVCYYCYL